MGGFLSGGLVLSRPSSGEWKEGGSSALKGKEMEHVSDADPPEPFVN